jgi:uncharacterized protein (DUF302 family)
MVKNILALIGAVVVVGMLFAFTKFGGKISEVKQLDPKAMGLYMDMFDTVLKTGNAAKGMVKSVKIEDDVTVDDVVEAMKAIAEENNMLQVGDTIMFDGSPIDSSGKKTHYTRILSYCSRSIAKQFLDFSPEFGAFMPCRIIIVENEKGEKWMYTMALDLMISGGRTLPPELNKLAVHVRDTMYKMLELGAKGDF